MGIRAGTVLEKLLSATRVSQFVAIGAVGAVWDNVTLATLREFAGMDVWLAKLLAAETAILLMFLLNERFTFAGEGDSDAGALGRRFLKSNGVRLGGLAVGFTVLMVLYEGFHVWYLAANVVGLGAGVVVNYLAESLITWQVQHG